MGLLADSKTRRKISSDPNNTKWSRDETTFGQKILRAQGWQPGQFLGAQDASHAELHTAANASYIRVALKDDMKGLGFNRAKEDEVTGLDIFSDVLSRLNGKSEADVEDGRQARLSMKTNMYVERRWGPMRFVRGGLLVGDKVHGIEEESADETTEITDSSKSNKRKASPSDDEETSVQEERRSKRQRKEERRKRKESQAATDKSDDESKAERRARRKLKKERKEKSKLKSEDPDEIKDEDEEDTELNEKAKTRSSKKKAMGESDDSGRSKKEKKNKKRKDEKRDKKRKAKEGSSQSDSESTPQANLSTASTPGQSTPVVSTGGTSTLQGSRNFVRARFIAQKRQAVLDTKALNQIFMVKT